MVVQSLLDRYIKFPDIEILWLYGELPQKLLHPDLSKQITPYLVDKTISKTARRFAFDLIAYCELIDSTDTLVDIALDTTDPFRESAVILISRFGTVEAKAALRPFLDEPGYYQITHEMMGYVLSSLLSSKAITIQEFFDNLKVSKIDDNRVITSAYYDLREMIPDIIEKSDLPIALDWVCKLNPLYDVDLDGRDIAMTIMRLAWQNLEDKAILKSFAKAALSRLIHHDPIIADDYKLTSNRNETNQKYVAELTTNHPKRRELFIEIFDVAVQTTAHPTFRILQSEIPLIIQEDISWLIDKLEHETDIQKQKEYVTLLRNLIAWKTREHMPYVAKLFDLSNSHPIVNKEIGYYFEYIQFASPKATKLREDYRQMQEVNEKRQERLKNNQLQDFDLLQELRNALQECEKDSAYWWRLNLNMLKQEDGYWGYSENLVNLTDTVAWELLNQKERTQVVICAYKYLTEQHPFIDSSELSLPLQNRRPALAGYRALFLLTLLELPVDFVSIEVWKKWACVVINQGIVTYYHENDKNIGKILVQRAYENAPKHTLDHLEFLLERACEADFVLPIWSIEQFELCEALRIEQLLSSNLNLVSAANFRTIFEYAVKRNNQVAIKEGVLRIQQVYVSDIEYWNYPDKIK